MIFLADFELRTTGYMVNDSYSKHTRLVEADTEEEARIKIYKEYQVDYDDYKDKSKSFKFERDEYNRKYLYDMDITPMIK